MNALQGSNLPYGIPNVKINSRSYLLFGLYYLGSIIGSECITNCIYGQISLCLVIAKQNRYGKMKDKIRKQLMGLSDEFYLFEYEITYFIQDQRMFSAEKSGKLKRQIDRYFLPIQINPSVILDIIRNEDKKNLSPHKIKQETLTKISEEAQKFELLRVTGRQLNSNFIPIPLKTGKEKLAARQPKLGYRKQMHKYKIHQLLSEPLQNIMQTISQDPDSHLFAKELEELHQYKSSCQQQQSPKINNATLATEPHKQTNYRQRFEALIMSNPALYKKMVHVYNKIENDRLEQNPSRKRQKRLSMSEAIMAKRQGRSFKKVISNNEKQLSAHDQKRLTNFSQYRQFLMLINFSNKMAIFPENDALYKGYICKGNNGLLVKSIIKSRPWWALRSTSDMENCHMVWTEWKKTKLTNSLPNKETKSERTSFYTTNYYDRINQSKGNREIEVIENKGRAKMQYSSRMAQVVSLKQTYINRIINSEKIISSKYINGDQMDSNYYVFTKNINDRKFQEISKRYLPPNLANYSSQQNGQKKEKTPFMLLNHVPGCYQLHSKKLLFMNMKRYYQKNNKEVFDYLPETYLIKDGVDDINYGKLAERWGELEAQKNEPSLKNKTKNVWICKPGENSNRGNGITVVSTLEQIKTQIKSMNNNRRTLIVQKYMENPYLYNRRKFDIRCYLLVTAGNGVLKAYFFNEGYIRTTSKQYNLKNLENKFVHLTNDAIQKKGEEYGKYESCNKVSFLEFEKYLEAIDKEEALKFGEAKKTIKQIAVQTIQAVASKLNPDKKQFCFELFGLDFMLDARMKPFLIQANSNPCLEVDGSVLSKIIPNLIENTIRIAIDPLYPPPYSQNWKTSKFSPGNPFEQNKFQLIYDSLEDPNVNLRQSNQPTEEMKEMEEQEEDCEKEMENQFEQ